MTPHNSRPHRLSNHSHNALVVGSVTVGLLTVSGGMAMASLRSPAAGTDAVPETTTSAELAATDLPTSPAEAEATTSPSGDICVSLGRRQATSLRRAVRRAEKSGSVTLRVQASSVVPCPTSNATTTPTSRSTNAGQPATTTKPTADTTGKPTRSPGTSPRTNPPTRTTPKPPVTSAAS